jgi:hypothetical protein
LPPEISLLTAYQAAVHQASSEREQSVSLSKKGAETSGGSLIPGLIAIINQGSSQVIRFFHYRIFSTKRE